MTHPFKPPRRLHLTVLGCLLAWSACLNPRPDDQPLASGNEDRPAGSNQDPSIEDPQGATPNNPADPGLDDGEDPGSEPDPNANENPPGNGDGSPAVPTDAGSADASTDAD